MAEELGSILIGGEGGGGEGVDVSIYVRSGWVEKCIGRMCS